MEVKGNMVGEGGNGEEVCLNCDCVVVDFKIKKTK